MQGDGTLFLLALVQVEGGQTGVPLQIFAVHIGVAAQTEGGEGAIHPVQGVHGVPVVGVGDDDPVLRHQVGEGAEGVLDVCQVFEKVQVIRFNI